MVTIHHEAPLHLLRECPELILHFLRQMPGAALPEFSRLSVRTGDANYTRAPPVEAQADLVLHLSDARGDVVFSTVVEVQRKIDPDKPYAWNFYSAQEARRHRCLVTVLVLVPTAGVARWAQEALVVGPRNAHYVFVIGPKEIPRITAPEAAQVLPELAVLSAMTHANRPGGLDVVEAALDTVATLDDDRATAYHDFIWTAMNQAARRSLEAKMLAGKYEYKSDFAKKHFAQGKAEGLAEGKVEGLAVGEAKGLAAGKAEAVLAVLAARGIPIGKRLRARVLACNDIATLDRWIARAATATRAAEVLAPA